MSALILVLSSDPNSNYSDCDGISDFTEIINIKAKSTNKTFSSGTVSKASIDTDSDGIAW